MMRRSLIALALLGLLAACSRAPRIADDQNTPQHQDCRREAMLSPEVRALDRQVSPVGAQVGGRVEEAKFLAARRAYRDCLRRNGLAMSGGVETVVPIDAGVTPLLWR